MTASLSATPSPPPWHHHIGLAFASGLAATTTIVHMLSAGDHIVSMDDLYGGTNRYLSKVACRMGISTSFVDAVDPQKVADAITDKTRVRGCGCGGGGDGV